MKRGVLKSAILLCVLVGRAPAADTPTDSLPVFHMNEIVVLGERLAPAASGSIHQIDPEQINRLDIHHAQQALAFAPGIYFTRTTRNETVFRLRGFDQRQINVFLDGVPISVPFDGMVDISQLGGDQVESIRISKGVPSVQYGANALGGTVNILTGFTRRSGSLKLRVEGSDHGQIFGSMAHQAAIGNFSYAAAFTVNKSPNFRLPRSFTAVPNENGGKRDNSASRKYGALLKLRYERNAAHRFSLNFHYLDNWFHASPQTGVSRPRYWRFPEWKKGVVSLNTRHLLTKKMMLRTVWYLDSYQNRLESYDDNTYTTQNRPYAFTSIYDDYSLGAIWYPHWKWFSRGSLNGVISWKRDTHRQKDNPDGVFQKYSVETWVLGLEQDLRLSSFLSASGGFDLNYLRPIFVEGGLLRDPILLVNGQLAIQYRFSGAANLQVSLAKKSRFPTLKELYSDRLGRNIPNPDLNAENSWNAEGGISWYTELGNLKAALFYSRLRDLIANRQLGDNRQQMQNIDKAILQGVEISYRKTVRNMNLDVNYTFLNALNRSADRRVDHLEYRPRHQLNGIVGYRPVPAITIQLEGRYIGHQYAMNPDTGIWQRFNDYGLINGRVTYRATDHMELYWRMNNALDRLYFTEAGVPMPGREIVFGCRMEW
ncbi:MAG: TonB-dependent receptor [Calditrichia bacterium]